MLREELVAEGELIPVEIDGLRGERFIVGPERPLLDRAATELAAEAATGDPAGARPGGLPPAVAFLAPLDPLVWDRDFLRRAFDFDYVWEVYVPAAKRRWGYYVLPILFGDRLVGRIEPRIDRRADSLRVVGLWLEDGFDPLASAGFVDAFGDALEAHRRFGGVSRIALPRATRHRPFLRLVREAFAGQAVVPGLPPPGPGRLASRPPR